MIKFYVTNTPFVSGVSVLTPSVLAVSGRVFKVNVLISARNVTLAASEGRHPASPDFD